MQNVGGTLMKWIKVTPELAWEWLESANSINRRVRDMVVERYANDMRAGRWRRTTTPIKFDKDKILLNGQHRLWAVVQSKMTVEFLVMYNCDPDERQVEDIGAPRNLHDILGFEKVHVAQMALGVISKMMASVLSKPYPSQPERREFFLKHQKAIEFALACAPSFKKRLSRASFFAVIARAFYTVKQDDLKRFVAVYTDGITGDESETSAIVLRHWVMTTFGQTAGSKVELECYLKTERALHAFLRKERVSRLIAVVEELYLLPGEARGEPGVRSTVATMKRDRAAARAAQAETRQQKAAARAVEKLNRVVDLNS